MPCMGINQHLIMGISISMTIKKFYLEDEIPEGSVFMYKEEVTKPVLLGDTSSFNITGNYRIVDVFYFLTK